MLPTNPADRVLENHACDDARLVLAVLLPIGFGVIEEIIKRLGSRLIGQ